jgi:hypothetical protein
LFPQKFLSVQFLLLLEFAAYKKIVIYSVIVKNISVASKTKQKKHKSKKKTIQKDIYWFLSQKTKQEKIRSNQLGIS